MAKKKKVEMLTTSRNKPGGDYDPPGALLTLDEDEANQRIAEGLAREPGSAVAPAPAAPPEPPKPPADKADRIKAIGGAIAKLGAPEAGGKGYVADNWTADGFPNVLALAEILGWKPTGEDRDTAWEETKGSLGL